LPKLTEYKPGTSFPGVIARTVDESTPAATTTWAATSFSGADTGGAVLPDYKPPFRFTGTIYNVTVDVSGDLIKDAEAEMRLVMARQ
jgi:hypothetical protein